MERFDIHKWKPAECRNVAEIEAALRKFNAIGKKIISLRAIGAAANLNYWEDCYEIDKAIKKAEKQGDKHILAPLRADIFEPVIFTFEDGSTLEILSKGEGKLLIASNQIPHGITEGLNHSNFDSEWLFRKIKNSALTGQVSWQENNECAYCFDFDMIEYGFHLSKNGVPQNYYAAISCEKEYEQGMFELSLHSESEGNSYINVPLAEYINAANNLRQVIIAESWLSYGGFFSINPLNRVEPTKDDSFGRVNFRKEMINIEDMEVDDFLCHFLVKYFDDNYDYGTMRDVHSEVFEFYSEFNLYTYETMRKMIADMRLCADMLENDLENPYLDELKGYIAHGGSNPQDTDTDEKKLNAIKQNAPVAIDFYRRLSARLEAMMTNAPDYQFICFFGP